MCLRCVCVSRFQSMVLCPLLSLPFEPIVDCRIERNNQRRINNIFFYPGRYRTFYIVLSPPVYVRGPLGEGQNRTKRQSRAPLTLKLPAPKLMTPTDFALPCPARVETPSPLRQAQQQRTAMEHTTGRRAGSGHLHTIPV